MQRKHVIKQRGVSLVEALVAMAVMAFGMLAIVGVQSTMRQNSDVAKQRSEAVRIAQETMEKWRAYSVLDTTAGVAAWADIVDPPADVVVAGYTTNTTYTLERLVVEIAAQNHKVLRVRVTWTDRTDTPQSVTLNSVIGLIDPAVTATLITPPAGNPNRRPFNRHSAIPLLAKEMGGGLSAFKPPVAGGGTVAWVFNNISGMIVGVCTVSAATDTAALTATDIASCSNNTLAHLVSGYVRFYDGNVQPTAVDARAPTGQARNLDMSLFINSSPNAGQPSCFDDAPETTVQAALQTAVAYYCLVPAIANQTWSGYSTIVPLAFTDVPVPPPSWAIPTVTSPTVSSHVLCRYTPAANDSIVVSNLLHPRLYRVDYADPLTQRFPLPMPPLPNQNFLVIEAGLNCPTDTPPDPATGHLVNGNTLVHLPWP